MTRKKACCDSLNVAIESPEIPIAYNAKHREYLLKVLDEGSSYLVLEFCPWCGQKLPASLRDAWFEALEKRDIDPYGENIPAEFFDQRWYSPDD